VPCKQVGAVVPSSASWPASVYAAGERPYAAAAPVANPAPQQMWVNASELYVRTAPGRTGNQPVDLLHYGAGVLTNGSVVGEDPYGTGQNVWYRIQDGRFVWGGGVSNQRPVVAPSRKPAQVHKAQPAARRRASSRVVSRRSSGARGGWEALRACESGGNYRADTGNGYYGAYQFSLGTWQGVGGHGSPADASPAEQDRRAQILYARRDINPWPVCGKNLR
jgi:hypothetical protein